MNSRMSSKLGQLQPWTAVLAFHDRLKNSYLITIQNMLMTCWLSGERPLPFGLLVFLNRIISGSVWYGRPVRHAEYQMLNAE